MDTVEKKTGATKGSSSFWSCECIGPQEGQEYCPCVLEMYTKEQQFRKSYEAIMQELSDLQQEIETCSSMVRADRS